MPRYEGMDEILARLSGQLTPSTPTSAPAPASVAESAVSTRAMLRLVELQNQAEDLRLVVGTGEIQQLSPTEREDLLARLGQVLRTLWACETALQSGTPGK